MNWYLEVLKNYAQFEGRARRKEYWMFILIHIIIAIALSIVDQAAGLMVASGTGVLSALYSVGVLVPSLAVAVRRLHDTGRSGWWLLLGLIPCLGALVLIFFLAQDGEAGANVHGPNPKLGATHAV
ncbi:MAG: DUF805 domain-containing protein [Acidobacteriota bacterium]